MKKHFCTAIISIAMMLSLSFSTVAFAAESITESSASNTFGDFVPLEESDMSLDEALDFLGLTQEDATGMNFYVSKIEPKANITVNSGESKQVDTTPVKKGQVEYGNVITIKGTRICWAVGVVYPNGTGNSCTAELCIYSGKYFHGAIALTPSHNQVTHQFEDISRDEEVQFKYTAPSDTDVTFVGVIGVSG